MTPQYGYESTGMVIFDVVIESRVLRTVAGLKHKQPDFVESPRGTKRRVTEATRSLAPLDAAFSNVNLKERGVANLGLNPKTLFEISV